VSMLPLGILRRGEAKIRQPTINGGSWSNEEKEKWIWCEGSSWSFNLGATSAFPFCWPHLPTPMWVGKLYVMLQQSVLSWLDSRQCSHKFPLGKQMCRLLESCF
jgi:hypothetical protein